MLFIEKTKTFFERKIGGEKGRMRCKYLEGEYYEGREIIIFCVNPDVIKSHKCPYGKEVECELNAHLRNLEEKNNEKSNYW